MAKTNSLAALPVSARYEGENAEDYFRAHFTADQETIRKLQSDYFSSSCNSKSVLLDFGCGDGTILRSLPAMRRVGIEVNPYCLDKIRQDNETSSRHIDVHTDIRGIAEASVDVVISNHALEHTLRPAETLEEVKRVLKPGGSLVLVTPFDDWRPPKNKRWKPNDKDNHLFTWTPMNIGNLLHEVGFEVLESRLCSRARSPKLIWIRHRLGEGAFDIACRLLAWVRNRREVLTVARKS